MLRFFLRHHLPALAVAVLVVGYQWYARTALFSICALMVFVIWLVAVALQSLYRLIRGRATGIVPNLVNAAIWLIAFAAMYASMNILRKEARQNADMVVAALINYRASHGGNWPARLEDAGIDSKQQHKWWLHYSGAHTAAGSTDPLLQYGDTEAPEYVYTYNFTVKIWMPPID